MLENSQLGIKITAMVMRYQEKIVELSIAGEDISRVAENYEGFVRELGQVIVYWDKKI
jgi:hypothetical protein